MPDDIQQLISQIEDALDTCQIDVAADKLDTLRTISGEKASLHDTERHARNLDQKLRPRARECIQSIQQDLNHLVRQDVQNVDSHLWQNQTEDLLRQWQRIADVLDDRDMMLDSMQKRVERFRDDLQQYTAYKAVADQIDDKLQMIKKRQEEGAPVAAIMPQLNAAYEIAGDALGNHNGNVRIEKLYERVKRHRERAAQEEEAMTSALMEKQFIKQIRYLQDTRKDEDVQLYNEFGEPVGSRVNRDEALQKLYEMARAYIARKWRDYAAEAVHLLDKHNPRAARQRLQRFYMLVQASKSTEVAISAAEEGGGNWEEVDINAGDGERTLKDLVPSLISENDTQDRLALEEDIRKSMNELEAAEDIAREASDLFSTNPTRGWTLLRQAEQHSPTTEHSIPVNQIRENMAIKTRAAIKEVAGNIQQLMTESKYDDARQELDQALRTYQQYQHPLVQQMITTHLQSLDTTITNTRDTIDELTRELDSIRKQAMEEPEAARKRLRQLQRNPEYAPYISLVPGYDDFVADLAFYEDTGRTYNDLKDLLSSDNLSSVEAAIRRAEKYHQENQNRVSNYNFKELKRALELQASYLKASLHYDNRKYDEASTILNSIAGTAGQWSDLDRKIDRLQRKVIESESEVLQAGDQLEQARSLIKNNPGEAIALLEELPVASDLRREKAMLLRDARRSYQQNIERQLEEMQSIQEPLAVDELDRLLDELLKLDDLAFKRFQEKTKAARLAAEARQAAERSDYESARNFWEQLDQNNTFRLQSADRQYVTAQLEETSVQNLEQQFDDAVQDRLNQTDPVTYLRASWAGEESSYTEGINDVQSELQRILTATQQEARRIQHKPGQVRLQALQIKILLLQGQLTLDEASQKQLLRRAEQTARTLQSHLKRLDTGTDNRKTLFKQATDTINRTTDSRRAGTAYQHIMQQLYQKQQIINILEFGSAIDTYNPLKSKLPILDEVIDQEKKVLKTAQENHLQALTDYTTPDAFISAGLLAVINQTDQDDNTHRDVKNVLDSLPRLTARLEERQATIQQALLEGHTFDMADDKDILSAQKSYLVQEEQALERLEQTLRRFEDRDLISEMAKSDREDLFAQIKLLRTNLGILDKQLHNLNEAINRIRSFQRGFQLSLQNWQHFLPTTDQTSPLSDELTRQLQRLTTSRQYAQFAFDPEQHEVFRQLKQDIAAHEERLTALAKELKALQQDVLNENFRRAYHRLQHDIDLSLIRPNDEALEPMPIYSTFEVEDIWHPTERIKRGFDVIQPWLYDKHNWLTIIEDWAIQYGVPEDKLTRGVVSEATSFVPWEVIRQQTRELILQGDFSTARQKLQEAQKGTDDQPGIEEAVKQSQDYPLAMQGSGEFGSFNQALKKAGTRRGEQLLRWVHTEAASVQRANLNELKRYLKVINEREDQWQTAARQHQLARKELLQKAPEPRRSAFNWSRSLSDSDCQKLENLLAKVQTSITDMESICPQHPALSKFKEWLHTSEQQKWYDEYCG